MFEKIFVGRSLNKLKSSPKIRYSKIVVEVDKDTKYTAGDDSAGTLTVKIPWGTQEIADNLLQQYRNYEYQPYKAEAGIVDPAAEIGDGVVSGRVYGGLFKQDLTFGKIPKSNFSAPQQEQINHEYPYTPKRDREVNREIGGVKTSLKVQAGLISAEVTNRENADNALSGRIDVEAGRITAEATSRTEADSTLSGRIDIEAGRITAEVTARSEAITDLSGKLEVQAGLISAKVSQTGGAGDGSFEYEIKPTYALWKSNGTELLRLEAGKAVLHGDIYAENGIFAGEVHAGKITYGPEDGYFNGTGLSAGTVTGGQHGKIAMGANGVGTLNVTSGVSTSLGYADISHKVLSEGESAVYLHGANVWAQSVFWYRNYQAVVKTINGETVLGLQKR